MGKSQRIPLSLGTISHNLIKPASQVEIDIPLTCRHTRMNILFSRPLQSPANKVVAKAPFLERRIHTAERKVPVIRSLAVPVMCKIGIGVLQDGALCGVQCTVIPRQEWRECLCALKR